MKRIIGLVLAVMLAGTLTVAGQARTERSSSPSRALHVTKECSEYSGQPGGYCTILTSNVQAIAPGSRVFYFEAAGAGGLDSDLAVYAEPGNLALGHVTLSLEPPPSGVITLCGGTGDFRNLRAEADVTVDDEGVWHWDGTYRPGGRGC
jgi:hypothetical protein